MLKEIVVKIPFDGFYESYSGYNLDLMLGDDERYFDDNNPLGENHPYIDCPFKIAAARNKYCNLYLDEINGDLDLGSFKFKFSKLVSPRFYNYTTDTILASVSPDFMQYILDNVYINDLEYFVKKSYKEFDLKYWQSLCLKTLSEEDTEIIVQAFLQSHCSFNDISEDLPEILSDKPEIYEHFFYA